MVQRLATTNLLRDHIQSLVVALILGWSSCAWAGVPDLTGIGYQQEPGSLLPIAQRFSEADGRSVTLEQVIGRRPTLLILGYYACPSLCGVVRDDALSAISRTGLVAGTDYNLVFLSIDGSETPAMAASAKIDDLRAYPAPGANQGWHFLTGPQTSIDAVEAATGFHSRYSVELKQFLHPAGFVVLTPEGRVASYLLGVGFRPDDVKAGVVNASLGRIEKSDNPILLLCFHYDAEVGRYSLDIIKVLRLAGVMTMLMILGIIYILHRKIRSARHRQI